jgi:hypothetical protein
MILFKYICIMTAIQNCPSEVKITTKGNNFGHLKIGGLQVVVSLLVFVPPIDRRSSHG